MKKTSNKTENTKYKVPDIRNGKKSCLKWMESVWTQSYLITLQRYSFTRMFWSLYLCVILELFLTLSFEVELLTKITETNRRCVWWKCYKLKDSNINLHVIKLCSIKWTKMYCTQWLYKGPWCIVKCTCDTWKCNHKSIASHDKT